MYFVTIPLTHNMVNIEEQMKSFIDDEEMRNYLLFEAVQEQKGIAFARMVRMDRAKNFLERISGTKSWENRSGSFVSPAVSRQEVYKLALKIPENLYSDDFIGIIKSSGVGYRVMLDLERVLNASQDVLYTAAYDHSEIDESAVQWMQTPASVVSQQMTWHKIIRLACKVDENLFFSQDQDSVGIVKSRSGGFRLMLDPQKFSETPRDAIFLSDNNTKREIP